MYQKKLNYIKTILHKIESEVLGAPIAQSNKDKEMIMNRHYQIRDVEKQFQVAREAYTRWNVSGKGWNNSTETKPLMTLQS